MIRLDHRYHEEQVWSDKVRYVSTYGSIVVLGVNVLVFALAIIVVEPWKRRRLAATFEQRVHELSNETNTLLAAGLQEVKETMERHQPPLAMDAHRDQSIHSDLVDTGALPERDQLDDDALFMEAMLGDQESTREMWDVAFSVHPRLTAGVFAFSGLITGIVIHWAMTF